MGGAADDGEEHRKRVRVGAAIEQLAVVDDEQPELGVQAGQDLPGDRVRSRTAARSIASGMGRPRGRNVLLAADGRGIGRGRAVAGRHWDLVWQHAARLASDCMDFARAAREPC